MFTSLHHYLFGCRRLALHTFTSTLMHKAYLYQITSLLDNSPKIVVRCVFTSFSDSTHRKLSLRWKNLWFYRALSCIDWFQRLMVQQKAPILRVLTISFQNPQIRSLSSFRHSMNIMILLILFYVLMFCRFFAVHIFNVLV